jgi:hypothetical protein
MFQLVGWRVHWRWIWRGIMLSYFGIVPSTNRWSDGCPYLWPRLSDTDSIVLPGRSYSNADGGSILRPGCSYSDAVSCSDLCAGRAYSGADGCSNIQPRCPDTGPNLRTGRSYSDTDGCSNLRPGCSYSCAISCSDLLPGGSYTIADQGHPSTIHRCSRNWSADTFANRCPILHARCADACAIFRCG